MAVTTKWFGKCFLNQVNGASVFDWDTDTIKVALCTSLYTPDQDVHDFFNDITNEVTATGYTAGGATLTTSAPTYTAGTNVIALDGNDTVWTITGSVTARYAIIYKDTGTPATSPLIAYVDFGEDKTATDDTFTITWDSSGILKITVS